MEEVEAALLRATVHIEAVDWLGRAHAGFGVVVGDAGYVLAPTRVVAHAETLRLVFADGVTRAATGVVCVDRARDLALLALDAPVSGLAVRAGDVASEEPVFAIARDGAVSRGAVWAQKRVEVTHDALGGLGGPVVDAAGRLVALGLDVYEGAFPLEPGERRETHAIAAPDWALAGPVTAPVLSIPHTTAPVQRSRELDGSSLGLQQLGGPPRGFAGTGLVPGPAPSPGVSCERVFGTEVHTRWVDGRVDAVAVLRSFGEAVGGHAFTAGMYVTHPAEKAPVREGAREAAHADLARTLDEHDWAGWTATRVVGMEDVLVFRLDKDGHVRTLTESCAGASCVTTLVQENAPRAR